MVINRASMPKQVSKGKKKKSTGKMRKKRKTAYKISYKHYAKSNGFLKNEISKEKMTHLKICKQIR